MLEEGQAPHAADSTAVSDDTASDEIPAAVTISGPVGKIPITRRKKALQE